MSKVSHRCGKGNCVNWCSGREADSHCRIYDDRRKCPKSMANRMSVAERYRRKVEKLGGGKIQCSLNW